MPIRIVDYFHEEMAYPSVAELTVWGREAQLKGATVMKVTLSGGHGESIPYAVIYVGKGTRAQVAVALQEMLER